jgi:DNA mismatch endonuclease (patch repair protein)
MITVSPDEETNWMSDVFSPEKRSQIMSAIKGKDTKPEIRVRKLLHAMGYRFRLHEKYLPGKPDIVLPKYKKVVFVHGCFWHGHKGCKRATTPKTRTDFWRDKIDKNKERDRKCVRRLRAEGYGALTVWECEMKNLDKLSNRLERYLGGKTKRCGGTPDRIDS